MTETADDRVMRQTIEFEVTAKQLRTMDLAADARGLNLSRFMLQAALAATEPPRDAIALLWPDMADEGEKCICLWSEACNEVDGVPGLLEIDEDCKVHSATTE